MGNMKVVRGITCSQKCMGVTCWKYGKGMSNFWYMGKMKVVWGKIANKNGMVVKIVKCGKGGLENGKGDKGGKMFIPLHTFKWNSPNVFLQHFFRNLRSIRGGGHVQQICCTVKMQNVAHFIMF